MRDSKRDQLVLRNSLYVHHSDQGKGIWYNGIHITSERKEIWLLLLGLLMDFSDIFKELFNALSLFHL